MKLPNNSNTLSLSSTNVPKKMEIDFTGKICQILSASLYTYKEEAIVRELCCNAVDAYNSECTDRPYDVHIPSRLDSIFYVRDYATGMSPEDIDNVYAHFGRSTKEHSNDFTGCLGIGSKSPFAYVRNFLVISYYNGVQYTYSIFKNELGEPQYTKMNEIATNEPNGLKVQFSVRDYDCEKFQQAACSILRFFDYKPTLLNANFSLDTIQYMYSFKYFDVCANALSHHGSTLLVNMGNIIYSLNQFKSQLSVDNEDEKTIGVFLNNFVSNAKTVIFKMPIGSFDFNPSREHISLDPNSFRNIKNFILESIKELQTTLIGNINKLDEEPTYWSALLKFNKFMLFNSQLSSEMTGKFYKDDLNCPYKGTFKLPKYILKFKLRKKSGNYKMVSVQDDILIVKEFNEKSIFAYINPKVSYVKDRIRHFLKENNNACIYLLYDENYKKTEDAEYYFNYTDMKNMFGVDNSDMVNIEECVSPISKKQNVAKTKFIGVKKNETRCCYYDIEKDEFKVNVLFDLNSNENIYYLKTEWSAQREYHGSFRLNYGIFYSDIKSVCQYGKLNPKGIILIPFRKNSSRKIIEHKNCKYLFDNLRINLGYDDYLLFINREMFNDKKSVSFFAECGMIDNLDKYNELYDVYNKKQFIYDLFLVNLSLAHKLFNNQKISYEINKIINVTNFAKYRDENYMKMYKFYYQHNDKDIGKELKEAIDEVYEIYSVSNIQ